MALRRMMIVLTGLLVCGQIGLYLAMIDYNRTSEMRSLELNSLRTRWEGLRGEILQSQAESENQNLRLAQVGQMEYKLKLYGKRFPEFSRIIDAVCEKSFQYGFHPDLIMGIMQTESNFNPFSVSFRGAYGLMQVHYAVWKDELRINKDHLFDIDYNLDLGLQILKRYFQETKGNVKLALLRYNNGYKTTNWVYPEKINQTAFCMNQNLENLAAASQ